MDYFKSGVLGKSINKIKITDMSNAHFDTKSHYKVCD